MSNVVYSTDSTTADETKRPTGYADSGTGSRDTGSGPRGTGTDDSRASALARIRAKSADIRRRRVESYVEAASDQPGTYRQEDGSTGGRLQQRMAGSSTDPAENGVSHLADGRLHGSLGRTNRPVGNGDSGVNPATGRPGESGSGRNATRPTVTAETTDDGAIIVGADDVPKRKRGRPKKNVDSQPVQSLAEPEPEPTYDERESDGRPRIINPLTLFRSGAPLSTTEANTLRPFLLEAVRTYSDYADDAITHSNRAHAEAVIWSTMDDSEIACIVDTLLSGGRKSAAIAYVARETVRIWRFVQVGVILVPRWFKMMQFYAQNGGFGLW